MPTPVLRLRKDIWTHFPVNVDALGKGANGAERHCIEWHNMKVRQLAQAQGKTETALKAELLPQLLHALSKSKAWTVEAPAGAGTKCIAILAMRFAPANNTRRVTKAPSPKNGTRNFRRFSLSPKRKSPSPKRNKTPKAKANGNNATKKVKNLSHLEGAAMIKKARGIMNLMSASTVERLSHEFASLTPKTTSESEELLKVVAEIALDQQAYHPLVIHLLHVLDTKHAEKPYHEKPSKVIGDFMISRAMEEPIFAKLEVAAEEANSPNKNLDDKVALQKRFFRSVMLFTGFLYRDGFLSWTSYKSLLRHFASMALETDPMDLDYRVYDGYAQGLMYTLIRAGARMVAEGGESEAMFQTLMEGIQRLTTTAKRGYVRTDAMEFLESAADGFKIKAGMTWTVGAPMTDIKPRAKPAAPKPAAEGLGADISSLWRRFPLDVKQVEDMYVVKVHKKKMQERFEKEAARYSKIGDLEAFLTRQVLSLIDHSEHWKRGPVMPGTLVTVVKKN